MRNYKLNKYTSMKKMLLIVASLTFALQGFSQTIVSTDVQKRNVVFEEYTGVNCGYCPNGHQALNAFVNAHPNKAFAVNIHQGGYATMYTTKWGNALAGQVNISGYPAFSMNRKVDNCKAINYYSNTYDYNTDGAAILSEDSPVNIAATASVDAATRIMTVHVELYYTADVAQDSNMLNVYLLQDNIIGPQSNYGNYNSAFIVSSDGYSTTYRHMHMFRDMVTGKQWGDGVAQNTNTLIPAGTFVEKDYTYTIPATISDVSVEMGDINLMVFVTEGKDTVCNLSAPNIYTGIKVIPTYTNLPENDLTVKTIEATDLYGCNSQVTLSFDVRNNGSATATSATIHYYSDVDATGKTYDWTGSIASFESGTITLPEAIDVTVGTPTTITVEVTSINGVELAEPKSGTLSHEKYAPLQIAGIPTLILKTDKNGKQITWTVTDSEGNVVNEGGPYANKITKDTVKLNGMSEQGCYLLEIKDSGKDGATGGSLKLVDPDGKTIMTVRGVTWGAGKKWDLQKTTTDVGLNEANDNICQAIIYPNPAKDVVTLSVNLGNADRANISVLDLMGRVVLDLGENDLRSGDNKIQINTTSLDNGLYYVQVRTNNGITTNKLNVVK
jgi:hypothetical protein